MRGENYVQCVYIAQGDLILHVSEEVIVAKNNNKKKNGRMSESDRRSKKAFKMTAHITKSNEQTLREVRAGIHV